MAGVRVVAERFAVSGAALNSMLSSPDGPVGTILLARAERVRATAESLAPVETAESAARHHRAPGRLRDSIALAQAIGPTRGGPGSGIVYEVGTDIIYARPVEFNQQSYLRAALSTAGGASAMIGGG